MLTDHDEKPDRVRLALGEDLAGEPFTRLLFELEHRLPASVAEVRELTMAEAVKLVREGGADVALTFDGRSSEELVQVRGWAEPLMLVVPIGHPLSERDEVDLREIGTGRLALPSAAVCRGYLAQIEGLLERCQVRLAERVSVRHWNTAVSFASTGRALALVPASFINGATSVAVLRVSQVDAELVTWILHREETSPAVSLVLDIATLIDAGSDPLRPWEAD